MRRQPSPSDELRAPALRDEEYPPLDGAYQNRTYGRPLSLGDVRGFWRETFRLCDEGRASLEAGLYLHWPFCEDRCAYCYCDSRVAASEAEQELCLNSLLEELSAFSGLFSGRRLSSLILAGGTPTQAAPARLEALLGAVLDAYAFASGADKAVEATPATLSAEKIGVLRRYGINRVDLGVDSLNEGVLSRAGRRGQSPASVRAACEGVLDAGMSLDVGLLYGLEGQEPAAFLRELRCVAVLGPARVRLYGFDPRPQTLFFQQGKRPAPELERESGLVFAAADELMGRSGYAPSRRVWSVPSSYLGAGSGAKSRCFGAGWYQHPPLGRENPVAGGIPPFFGMPLDLTEEKRAFLISGLSVLGTVRRADYLARFGEDVLASGEVARALRALAENGDVVVDGEKVRVRGGGRRSLSRLYGGEVLAALAQRLDLDEGTSVFESKCRVYEKEGAR